MRISPINSVKFNAMYVSDTKAKSVNLDTNDFEDCNLKFLQFDRDNYNDVQNITDAVYNKWKGDCYGRNIAYIANILNASPNKYQNKDIFILTSQKNNFDNLDSDKILGLISVHKNQDKSVVITNLHVNPSQISHYRFDKNELVEIKYKHLGTSILNSIKKIFPTKIYVNSSIFAKSFYLNNGFVPADNYAFKYSSLE